MKILAIVDPQNDFIDGTLAVGYEKWAPACEYIQSLLDKGGYDKILMTKDWHPADHCSFAPQGGPWPAHCVAGTPGAEPFWKLDGVADTVILKGRDPEMEEYGVDLLAGISCAAAQTAASAPKAPTLLPDKDIDLYIVGLCYDYCVVTCARMTSEAHPEARVTVLRRGTVAIDPAAEPDFGAAKVID